MARSTNMVILTGHLGKDPELRVGNGPVRFSLATSENWRDKATGERKEKTDWHHVVIFKKTAAEFAEKYLKKGSHVTVIGKLKNREWTDDKGTRRFATEIVLGDFYGEVISLESSGSGAYKPPAPSRGDYGYSEPEHTSDREPGDEPDPAFAGMTQSAYAEQPPKKPASSHEAPDKYYKGNLGKPKTTMDKEPYIDKDRDSDVPF